jgi:hypothetical protein
MRQGQFRRIAIMPIVRSPYAERTAETVAHCIRDIHFVQKTRERGFTQFASPAREYDATVPWQ